MGLGFGFGFGLGFGLGLGLGLGLGFGQHRRPAPLASLDVLVTGHAVLSAAPLRARVKLVLVLGALTLPAADLA